MCWPTEPRSKAVSGSTISKSCHTSGTFLTHRCAHDSSDVIRQRVLIRPVDVRMRGAEGESNESGQPSAVPEGKEASAHGNESIGVAASNGIAVPQHTALDL